MWWLWCFKKWCPYDCSSNRGGVGVTNIAVVVVVVVVLAVVVVVVVVVLDVVVYSNIDGHGSLNMQYITKNIVVC